MRYFFLIFHALLFILFAVLFGFSLYHHESAGFFLVPMVLFLLICIGLSKRSRLTVIPLSLILMMTILVALFVAAGSIAWPEPLVMKIFLICLIFFLVELVNLVFIIFFLKQDLKPVLGMKTAVEA